jgi:hypothetical protein
MTGRVWSTPGTRPLLAEPRHEERGQARRLLPVAGPSDRSMNHPAWSTLLDKQDRCRRRLTMLRAELIPVDRSCASDKWCPGRSVEIISDGRISRAVDPSNSRDPTKRTRCGATLKSARWRQPSSGVGMERPRRHLRLALNDGQVGLYRGGRHGPCDLVLANRA